MLSFFFAKSNASASDVTGAPNRPSVRADSVSNQNVSVVKITIKVAGNELHATLADNPTAREFAALLPVSVSMEDLFGREKAGPLPRAISTAGPHSDIYNVGDIGYWSPGHDIAIYYRQDGDRIPSPGIINIGHIDSGVAAFNVPDSVKVIIERTR